MVTVKKLIKQSRTTEANAAGIRIIGVFNDGMVTEDAHLNKIFASLVPLSAQLTLAINQDKTTSELDPKDEVRDHKVQGIHYLILGSQHHPDAAVSNAAKAVGKVFGKYGLGIINQSYAAETALIQSLLKDLEAPELQAPIAAISGLETMIADLRTAQADFEQTRIKYEEAKAKESTLQSATALKDELVTVINEQLVTYLRAMVQVDEAKYSDFARTIAIIIDENNGQVKRRRTGTAED